MLPKKKQLWTGLTIPSILGVGGAPMHINQRLKMFQPKSAAGEKLWEEGHPFVPLVKGRRRRGSENKGLENNGSSSLHFRPRPHTFIFIAIFSSTSTYHHHEAKQWELHFRPPPSTFIFKHFVLLRRLLPQLSTDHIPVQNIYFGLKAPNKELFDKS